MPKAKKSNDKNDKNSYRAAIYARYSSSGQREESIEGQIRECTDFAERNNITIVKIYADKAVSGKSTDKRDEFRQMMKDAEKGIFNAVICWKIDRFARNRYDSATHKAKLKKHGIRLFYAKESIPEGPEGIMFESVIDGMAEYYSVRLSSNIIRGIKDNAEKALYNGRKIFGFSVDSNRKYVEDPDTAPLVRRIFKEYSSGIPMAVIARRLNEQGFVTSRGGEFNVNGLRHILHNEAYIGVYKYSGIVIEGIIYIKSKHFCLLDTYTVLHYNRLTCCQCHILIEELKAVCK